MRREDLDAGPDVTRDDDIAAEVALHERMCGCRYCRSQIPPNAYAAGARHCSAYCRHQDDDTGMEAQP